jgi:hypothetical protein
MRSIYLRGIATVALFAGVLGAFAVSHADAAMLEIGGLPSSRPPRGICWRCAAAQGLVTPR